MKEKDHLNRAFGMSIRLKRHPRLRAIRWLHLRLYPLVSVAEVKSWYTSVVGLPEEIRPKSTTKCVDQMWIWEEDRSVYFFLT